MGIDGTNFLNAVSTDYDIWNGQGLNRLWNYDNYCYCSYTWQDENV